MSISYGRTNINALPSPMLQRYLPFLAISLICKCQLIVITLYIPKCYFNMDISVIPIGNSKGIRLSKTILDKYHITDTIELVLEKDHIILKPKTSSRAGWETSFKKMHDNG